MAGKIVHVQGWEIDKELAASLIDDVIYALGALRRYRSILVELDDSPSSHTFVEQFTEMEKEGYFRVFQKGHCFFVIDLDRVHRVKRS
jgi:hypothetical protein